MIQEVEAYDFNESLVRLSSILKANRQSDEKDFTIPSEAVMAELHQKKVNCTVMAIRPSFMKKDGQPMDNSPAAMQILEAYMMEIVAILRGCSVCKDFSMVNDTIVAIFETPLKKSILPVVDAMSRIGTMRTVVEKMAGAPHNSLRVKVSMHFGSCEAYYIGGRNSPQPSVFWTGKAVNAAMILLDKTTEEPLLMMATSTLYNNLVDGYQKFFYLSSFNGEDMYEARMYNVVMNNWIQEH